MTSKLRAVAEDRFAALTRRNEAAMHEVKTTLQTTRENTERLRALRLARDAALAEDHAAALVARRKKS